METINAPVSDPSLAVKDTQPANCPCGHNLFRQLFALRIVSAIQSPTGRTEYAPVPVLVCDKCGERFKRPPEPEPSKLIT